MKKLLPILFTCISLFAKAQQKGIFNTIAKERPADYEYLSSPDSTGKRTLLKTSATLNVEKAPSTERIQSSNIKLPYPVIFIHGLNSNADTWLTTTNFMSSQYGLVNGGRFDYCLNYDGNNATANTSFAPTAGADIAIFSGTWVMGDYYYVNFDVGNDGGYEPASLSSYNVKSNQQAVAKQGVAVRDAIDRVLQLTGRDKVVLMGHSMGGLAAREYLQNLTQPDGQHHITKLVTTGTPHGGSDVVTAGVLYGPDGQSEAVRDLRTTYYYSGNAGVYLSGGLEDLPSMNDQLCCYFYNADVNCNGITEENIVGLNQKNIYTNLNFSCIIGECTGCIITPGDGVVSDVSANLNNYYSNITKNIFYYSATTATEIHTDLPAQIIQNMQGLDESDNYDLAYNIGFDTSYTGFTTVQATGNTNYPVDFDLYKFTVPVQSDISVSLSNISLSNLSANIVDATHTIVGSAHSNSGASTLTFSQTLNAGDYYFSVFGTEAAANYIDPYSFILNQTTATGINSYESLNNILVYPNPINDNFIIETNTTDKLIVDLSDVNGRQLFNKSISEKTTVDVTTLNEGVYTLTIKNANSVINKKLVIVR